mgnify:CR=1 FL=1
MKSFESRLPLRTQQHNQQRPKNKRVKIALHHRGNISSRGPLIGTFRTDIEDFLNDVWCQFGKITKTYYTRDLETVILTFTTHEQAIFALAGLKDQIEMQAAVQAAVRADLYRTKQAKQLFVERSGSDNTVTATWVDEER